MTRRRYRNDIVAQWLGMALTASVAITASEPANALPDFVGRNGKYAGAKFYLVGVLDHKSDHFMFTRDRQQAGMWRRGHDSSTVFNVTLPDGTETLFLIGNANFSRRRGKLLPLEVNPDGSVQGLSNLTIKPGSGKVTVFRVGNHGLLVSPDGYHAIPAPDAFSNALRESFARPPSAKAKGQRKGADGE